MQTVVETSAFIKDASGAGMSSAEVFKLIDLLAANPKAGVEIKGSGGCRKLRVAGKGKGKSGGFRVISFYSGVTIPVFLLTVFSKGERDNLTDAECNALKKITKNLVAGY
jgi:hypothetical protein